MNFDELCDFVLLEADNDYVSGASKQFYLAADAITKIENMKQEDLSDLLRKTELPFTVDFMEELVDDMRDFMPTSGNELKSFLKTRLMSWINPDMDVQNLATAGATTKSKILFAALKKELALVVSGVPSAAKEDRERDPSDDEIEKAEREAERIQ